MERTREEKWWSVHVSPFADSVEFSSAFLPKLIEECHEHLSSKLQHVVREEKEEIRVFLKWCLGGTIRSQDVIYRSDFALLIARFGPLHLSLSKILECFYVHNRLVPWFHGLLSRQQAEHLLATQPDGTFLIRFSESHPKKFTLTYVKVHTTPSSRAGKREIKNCLIENLGSRGYALMDSSTRRFHSLADFIQKSSARLKQTLPSELSIRCNQEISQLQQLRHEEKDKALAIEENQEDYTAFQGQGQKIKPEDEGQQLLSSPPPLSPVHDNQYSSFSMTTISSHHHSRVSKCLPSSPNLEKVPVAIPPELQTSSNKAHLMIDQDYQSFLSIQSTASKRPQHLKTPGKPPLSPGRSTASACSSSPPRADDDYGVFAQEISTSSTPCDSDYASFHNQSLVHSPLAKVKSQSPVDDYGSFLESPPPPPRPSSRPQLVSQPSLDAGNYGSFALLDEEKPTTTNAMRQPSLSSSSIPIRSHSYSSEASDDYGCFQSSSSSTTPSFATSSQVAIEEEKPLSPPPSPPSSIFQRSSFAPSPSPTPPSMATTPLPLSSSFSSATALMELNAGVECWKNKQLDEAVGRFIAARMGAKECGDQVIEARALGNLGTVYKDMKLLDEAVRCYHDCLAITRSIKDAPRERIILNNLVLAYMTHEEYDKALEYCQIQLEITASSVNRRKILSRMSLLREQALRRRLRCIT